MKFQNTIIALSCAFLVLGCGEKDEKKQQSQNTPAVQTPQTTTLQTQSQSQSTSAQTPTIAQTQAISEPERLPDNIELAFLSGEKLAIKKEGERLEMTNKDKATLFVFFATWCPPCRAEIPHLNNLNDKFKKELNIVAVLLEDKNTDEIKKFVQKYNIKYNVAVGEGNYLLEKAMGGIVGLPSSALFKPNGDFATGYKGMVPEEMLERDILQAIEQ